MIGLICGLLLCHQPSTPEPPRPNVAPAKPGDPACREYRIEFNGNPENWAFVRGCLDSAGVVTWNPDDQDFSVGPEDWSRGHPVEYAAADRWVPIKVNGRQVSMWGWRSERGDPRWRVDGQRTHAMRDAGGSTGHGPASKPAPVKSGVVLPSGFEPNQDPQTGALLMGVDAKGLAKDGEQVRASDPETKAEGEDVVKFYEMGPDASAKAVARKLPPIISPNTWASIFGYDLQTALTRIGGVVLLAGAAYKVHGRFSGAA